MNLNNFCQIRKQNKITKKMKLWRRRREKKDYLLCCVFLDQKVKQRKEYWKVKTVTECFIRGEAVDIEREGFTKVILERGCVKIGFLFCSYKYLKSTERRILLIFFWFRKWMTFLRKLNSLKSCHENRDRGVLYRDCYFYTVWFCNRFRF